MQLIKLSLVKAVTRQRKGMFFRRKIFFLSKWENKEKETGWHYTGVSKPSWSITLLLEKAKISHSRSALYKHHYKLGKCKNWSLWVWIRERGTVFEISGHSLFTKCLQLVTLITWLLKKVEGLLAFQFRKSSLLRHSIIYVFARMRTCQLISSFHLKANIITSWWSNSSGE